MLKNVTRVNSHASVPGNIGLVVATACRIVNRNPSSRISTPTEGWKRERFLKQCLIKQDKLVAHFDGIVEIDSKALFWKYTLVIQNKYTKSSYLSHYTDQMMTDKRRIKIFLTLIMTRRASTTLSAAISCNQGSKIQRNGLIRHWSFGTWIHRCW